MSEPAIRPMPEPINLFFGFVFNGGGRLSQAATLHSMADSPVCRIRLDPSCPRHSLKSFTSGRPSLIAVSSVEAWTGRSTSGSLIQFPREPTFLSITTGRISRSWALVRFMSGKRSYSANWWRQRAGAAIPIRAAGQTTWKRPDVRAGWSPTNAISSRSKSWRRWPEQERDVRMKSPTTQTPTSGSKSISRLRRSTVPGSMPSCRLPRFGDSTAKASKSSSSDWVRTDLTNLLRAVHSCQFVPERCAGGWLRKTQATSRLGHADSVPGLGLNWSPVARQ